MPKLGQLAGIYGPPSRHLVGPVPCLSAGAPPGRAPSRRAPTFAPLSQRSPSRPVACGAPHLVRRAVPGGPGCRGGQEGGIDTGVENVVGENVTQNTRDVNDFWGVFSEGEVCEEFHSLELSFSGQPPVYRGNWSFQGPGCSLL